MFRDVEPRELESVALVGLIDGTADRGDICSNSSDECCENGNRDLHFELSVENCGREVGSVIY